jgi:hypothetical protein
VLLVLLEEEVELVLEEGLITRLIKLPTPVPLLLLYLLTDEVVTDPVLLFT